MEQKTKKVRVLKCKCGEYTLSHKNNQHVDYFGHSSVEYSTSGYIFEKGKGRKSGHTFTRSAYRQHSIDQCFTNWPRFEIIDIQRG